MANSKDGAANKAAGKTKKGKAEQAPKSVKEQAPQVMVKGYVPNLYKMYRETITPKLMKDFEFTTVMQVPKLEKIVINQGIGSATQDKKLIEAAQQELTLITGQKEFLERLIAVSLPRIRDFNGINEKFDGRGNYTLGIKEQIIFPEIDIDKVTKILGLEITFVTSTKKDEEAFALLREFGLPFKNIKKQS